MKTTGRFLKSSYGCFVGRQSHLRFSLSLFFTPAQCDRPCLNGGFCARRNHCQCRSGFHGDQCEKGQGDHFIEFATVYHLQEVFGKSSWKVLFGWFRWKIFESNVTSGKVVLFSRSEYYKRKYVFRIWYHFQTFASVIFKMKVVACVAGRMIVLGVLS